MTEETGTERPDRIILAFSPSDADHATEGHVWSLYNPSLDDPYTVENTDEKISQALDRIDPRDYTLGEDEHWIRLDWRSIMDGDPERLRCKNNRDNP